MGRPAVFGAAVVMMAMQPLLIHLAAEKDGERLHADTFILTVEALKFILCATVLIGRRLMGLEATVWCGLSHTAAFAIPACIYLVMNIIKVVAARNLAPPIFQLLAASKIICTALASWLLMSKDLSSAQWAAMITLTVGVALGQQWDGAVGAEVPVAPALMMFFNSMLSALAAVYTERVLKARGSAALTIFATNLHMSAHTLIVNIAKAAVWEVPVLVNFSSLGWRTWAALGNEAVNGILVSAIMRHADSIVKNYAFSTSIFATAALSVPILDYWPKPQFFAGAALVGVSMALYTSGGHSQVAKTDVTNGSKKKR